MSGELLQVAEAIVVEPGDTLIVRVSPHTTALDVFRLKEAIEQRLPGVTDVAIIAAEQIAVFRPDIEPLDLRPRMADE